MNKISKFEELLVKIVDQKNKELDRRGKRANDLLQKSEEVLKNKEQWEAYQVCIEHQQKKMTRLVHDLLIIGNVLETMHEKRSLKYGNHGTQK